MGHQQKKTHQVHVILDLDDLGRLQLGERCLDQVAEVVAQVPVTHAL